MAFLNPYTSETIIIKSFVVFPVKTSHDSDTRFFFFCFSCLWLLSLPSQQRGNTSAPGSIGQRAGLMANPRVTALRTVCLLQSDSPKITSLQLQSFYWITLPCYWTWTLPINTDNEVVERVKIKQQQQNNQTKKNKKTEKSEEKNKKNRKSNRRNRVERSHLQSLFFPMLHVRAVLM